MTFEVTRNFKLVREIMTHPRVYPHVTDDFSPEPEEYRPLDHPGVIYVLVRDAGELLGMWVFCAQNGVCWEVHTCLLPSAWGARGKRAARAMAAWVWANTGCQRIVTAVPEYNRLAVRFAELAGMREYGRNERSYKKHGRLMDQILLGLSRPTQEKECQQQQ